MTRFAVSLLASVMFVALTCLSAAAQKVTPVPLNEDQVVYEFVGQFNNTQSASQQFGYLSKINGLDSIFNGEPESEATALFTFVTNANTDRVIVNGSFKILNRTGTTTIYLNTPPSDFTDPSTFSQGTPIQISTYSQQVIVNTTDNSFQTVHMNTVTCTKRFSLNGTMYRLGKVGESFRTNYSGQVNPNAPPGGWFGGHAVGAKRMWP
jgi:hypothetical protein